MDFKELIERINLLYHKSVEEGLTEEEYKEQQELKKIYIQGIKNNVVAQLGTIKPGNQKGVKN